MKNTKDKATARKYSASFDWCDGGDWSSANIVITASHYDEAFEKCVDISKREHKTLVKLTRIGG